MGKTLNRIIQVLILIGLIVFISWRIKPEEKTRTEISGHSMEFLSDYFDGNYSVFQDSSARICEIHRNQGVAGHVLFSSDLKEQSRGFAGVVNFAVVLSDDFEILGIKVLSHEETPSYMNWITRDGFFDQFVGMKADEAMVYEPDMITGATMSCTAISTDLKSVLANVTEYKDSQGHIRNMWLLKNTVALLFLVFALLHFFFPKNLAKTRILLLVLSIGVMGFWCGYFLSLTLFHSWLVNGIVLKMQAVMFSIFVFSVSLPLFTKRSFYCTYVCPFGAMQELAGKINPNRKAEIPKSVKPVFRWLRFAILMVILILLAIGFELPLGDMEPFSLFQVRAASLFVMILAGFMIVLSVFISRPWCRYFCPTGMLLTLLRKPVFYKRKHRKS